MNFILLLFLYTKKKRKKKKKKEKRNYKGEIAETSYSFEVKHSLYIKNIYHVKHGNFKLE